MDHMKKPKALSPGDRVAIVSLSSGILGEPTCLGDIEVGTHRLREIGLQPVFMPNALKGIDYLQEHPQARAADLKAAFADSSIKGIICAIGGDDSYRLLPYLLEDQEFCQMVKTTPKLFTGFSDTTINHLMFYQLGMMSFYGPNFICDLSESGQDMLPYTKAALLQYFSGEKPTPIRSSAIWYEERTDFSPESKKKRRVSHKETHGFQILQGSGTCSGQLLGGCLESLYDILSTNRYSDQQQLCRTYSLFPQPDQWAGKILFIETCEEKPVPGLYQTELETLKQTGIFERINGIIVGKPQDEQYYEDYKEILIRTVARPNLPILYNVNFGHAYPRTVLAYGALVTVDLTAKEIRYEENILL